MVPRIENPALTVDPFAADIRADDLVQRFTLGDRIANGRLGRLGPLVDTILRQHDYPLPVAMLLGECLALAAVLATGLKYDGVFTLQSRSDGPIRLLVADVTSSGGVRGYANFDKAALAQAMTAIADPLALAAPVPRLLGKGYLALTLDQGPDTDRYQGLVELNGMTLSDCAQTYFAQSEQIETSVRLVAAPVEHARRGGDGTTEGGGKAWRSACLLLQRLPTPDLPAEDGEEAWRQARILMASGTSAELLNPSLPARGLLYRLFVESGVRVSDPQLLEPRCRCNGERVEAMLAALPKDEIPGLMVEGIVTVTCQFCNVHYRFDDAKLRTMGLV